MNIRLWQQNTVQLAAYGEQDLSRHGLNEASKFRGIASMLEVGPAGVA
jgi:hypothetical protein